MLVGVLAYVCVCIHYINRVRKVSVNVVDDRMLLLGPCAGHCRTVELDSSRDDHAIDIYIRHCPFVDVCDFCICNTAGCAAVIWHKRTGLSPFLNDDDACGGLVCFGILVVFYSVRMNSSK